MSSTSAGDCKMQSIEKKPRKKATGWVIALLMLALILAGFLFFSKEKIPPPPKKPDFITLFQTEEDTILALTINPTGGETYTLIKTEDGYAIKGRDSFPLNQDLAASMFDMVRLIRASERIAVIDQANSPEDFGITQDSLTITLRLKNGQQVTTRFGYPLNLESYSQYLMMDGDTTVYLTSDNYPDVCDFTDLQLHTVPGINFTPDLVDAIHVTGERELSLERVNDFWQLTKPYTYPAQPSKVQAVLEKIGKMRLAAYEAEGTEANLAKYGLASPRFVVCLKMAESVISSADTQTGEQSSVRIPAHEQVFQIGRSFDGIGFYCLYEHKIYKATMLSMGFLENLTSDDLALTTPVHLSINALTGLDVAYENRQASFTLEIVEQVAKNNQLVVDEHGRIQYDLWLFAGDRRLDPAPFVAAYTQATKLSASANLPEGYQVAGKPLGSVSLSFEGGHMEVQFFPYDALTLSVQINGKALHMIDKESVQIILNQLIKAADNPYID